MTILNFKRADGLDNLPGFYKIQYVPARLVVSIPASVNGNVEDVIVLADGAEWKEGEFIVTTANFGDRPESNIAGTFRPIELSGVFPGSTPARTFNFYNMTVERYFIVLVFEMNGYVRIVGDKECPAEFAYSEAAGLVGAPGGTGYNLAFRTVSETPALYYQAEVVSVEDDPVYPVPVLPGGTSIRFVPTTQTSTYLEDARLTADLDGVQIEITQNNNVLVQGIHYTLNLASNRIEAITPPHVFSASGIFIKIFYNT
jgi:hypothetical protein